MYISIAAGLFFGGLGFFKFFFFANYYVKGECHCFIFNAVVVALAVVSSVLVLSGYYFWTTQECCNPYGDELKAGSMGVYAVYLHL